MKNLKRFKRAAVTACCLMMLFVMVACSTDVNSLQKKTQEIGVEQAVVNLSHFHGSLKWKVKVQPTCIKKGLKVRYCKKCHKNVATESIPMLKHHATEMKTVKEATCKEAGLQEVRCKKCGKVLASKTIDKLEHQEGEWTTIQEPTCTAEGIKELCCSVCNELLKSETIPVIEHHPSDWITVSVEDLTRHLEKRCTMCNKVLDTATTQMLARSDGLIIPSVGVNIRLVYFEPGSGTNEQAQAIVDMPETGIYYDDGKVVYIGDHNYQGFDKMMNCSEGSTAYIYGKKVTCYKASYGTNTGALYLSDGTPANEFDGYIMYTCTDMSGRNVFMTFWH